MVQHLLRADRCFRAWLDCSLGGEAASKRCTTSAVPRTDQDPTALYRQCTDLQITSSAQLDVGFLFYFLLCEDTCEIPPVQVKTTCVFSCAVGKCQC